MQSAGETVGFSIPRWSGATWRLLCPLNNMKEITTTFRLVVTLAFLIAHNIAQAQPAQEASSAPSGGTVTVGGAPINMPTTMPQPTANAANPVLNYSLAQAQAHSRLWQSSSGQSVTEIGSGLNYLSNGLWVPSNPSFVASADGSSFVASQIQDPTQLAANLNSANAVTVVTPDNVTLRSTPIGIGLFDPVSGLAVLVASITNTTGVLADSQDVVYSHAFVGGGIDAAVVYSLPDTGSFHQDVVFTGLDPNFDPTAFGFAASSVNGLQLEVITEFYDMPQPQVQERDLYIEQDPNVRATMASPDFVDHFYDFGHYVFSPGHTSMTSVPGPLTPGVPVAKEFTTTSDGRTFLVESVRLRDVLTELQALPPPQVKTSFYKRPHARKMKIAAADLPHFRPGKSDEKRPKAVAMNHTKPKGLAVDYIVTLSSLNEPTIFRSDCTYFVSQSYYFTAIPTIESAVFKFPTNFTGALVLYNGLNMSTTNYRPAIFTAADDNTAGAALSTNIWPGYTGTNSTNYYGNCALLFETASNVTLNNLRFIDMNAGIAADVPTPNWQFSVSHCQFVGGSQGIIFQAGGTNGSYGVTSTMNNCLFVGVQCPFLGVGVGYTNNGYNCTVDSTGLMCWMVSGAAGYLTFTNSIFSSAAWGTLGSVSLGGAHNGFFNTTAFGSSTFPSSTYPYQWMAGGYYYLTNTSSFLTDATTNIPASLLAQLETKTVLAPQLLSATFTTDTTLSPVVPRDTAGTALGFHFDPIDYLGACTVTNATITLANGVVLAYYDNCLTWLQNGSQLVSQGTPTQRNYIVYYTAVQEEPVMLWGGSVAQAYPIVPLPVGSSANQSVFLQLTTICAPTGETNLWLTGDNGIGGQVISNLTLQDCEVYGSGANWVMNENANTPTVGFTNNVFHRVPFAVNSNAKITSYNNLFYGTTNTNEFTISMTYRGGAPSPNTHENNVFDGVKATLDGTVGYNAYVNGATNTSFTNNNDIITNITWQGGPLGFYYQPSTSPLLTNGSTFATNLGLYHYTVLTNETVEATNIVSRGYHYIALGADGLPLDTYEEGVADYIRDRNGNGIYDKGDPVNWQSPFNIYDQGTNYGGYYPAHVRLSYWRFNSSALTNENGDYPYYAYPSNLTTPTSWSGTSVALGSGTNLQYRTVETNGWTNLDTGNGTVRFWFKPYWSSANIGGTGPGSASASFIDIYNGGTNWFLAATPNGNTLQFVTASNNILDYTCGGGWNCTFVSNRWSQIALTYSPSNIAAYINGALIGSSGWMPQTNGLTFTNYYEPDYGMFVWPAIGSSVPFFVGNASAPCPLKGEMDELETFNYPLSAQAIAYGFATFNGCSTNNTLDSDYDGRSDLLENLVDGTNPNLASSFSPCRLGYWRFNSSQWIGEQGQFPTSANNVSLATGWSGGALNVGSAANSGLTYPDVNTNGCANINCRQGSVRFWFRPNSLPLPSSAPFIYVGNNTSYWTLKASASGTALVLTTVSDSVSGPVVSSSAVNFQTNQWCQIVCTYGPSGSALYANGMLAVTNGLVWTNWPDASARAFGMIIGNDWTTNHPINGKFDELETFNYQLNTNQIWTNFQAVWNIDNNLDGVPDIIQDTVLRTNMPFLGQPVVVTGTIEAEQFDRGGLTYAYLNVSNNPTSSYRTTGMCITTNNMPFGYCLDQTRANEWASYTINVLVPQTYAIETRVQGLGTNSTFELSFAANNGSGYATYTNTGPLTIGTTAWTNITGYAGLKAGTNIMTLKFLSVGTTNTGSATYVGRFDYMTVYPWWNPPTFPTSPSNYVSGLLTGSDFLTASNNAYIIQTNVNYVEGMDGGVVAIEQGTFYVAQANPNEAQDAWFNAVVGLTNSNIKICGAGTNTLLIGYNRATTMVYIGRNQNGSPGQCHDIQLQNLTFQARPHLAVNTNDRTQVVYQPGMLLQPGGTTGALATLLGETPSAFAYNILFTNCQFVDADRSIDSGGNTSNVLIQSCNFVQFEGTNGIYFPGSNNPSIQYSSSDNHFLVGILGQSSNYNIGVLGCSYNGNPNFSNQITSNPNLTNYIANQFGAGNGLFFSQNGGNFFLLRNFITNNAEEAINFYAGPVTAAGNTFWSWGNNNSCGAFAANLSSSGATGASYPNYSATFIGNSVTGNSFGAYNDTTNEPSPYSLNVSGNSLSLFLPALDPSTNGNYNSSVYVWDCQNLNVSGNTMNSGGFGVYYTASCSNSVILANNFSGTSFAGIEDFGTGPEVSQQVIGNTLSSGFSFHLKANYWEGPNWFLYNNQFVNTNDVTVPAFTDPADLWAHITQ
jgi:hypothetical protein